ncbi:MAG: hypothetical protein ACREX9_22310, partial [Gammaproteobacteria bacterium]
SERCPRVQGMAQRRRYSGLCFKPLQHRLAPSSAAPCGQAATPPSTLLRVLEIGALFLRTRAAPLAAGRLADASK